VGRGGAVASTGGGAVGAGHGVVVPLDAPLMGGGDTCLGGRAALPGVDVRPSVVTRLLLLSGRRD
jgi:hypothetical protein